MVYGKAPEVLVSVIGEAPIVVKAVQERPVPHVTEVVATEETFPAPLDITSCPAVSADEVAMP
jgi:hypothetical protein